MALSGGGATGMFGVGYKEDSQVYVLDTDEAVETCFSEQSVKVGLTASVSLGPLGRSIDGSAFIGMDAKYVDGREALSGKASDGKSGSGRSDKVVNTSASQKRLT